MLKIAWSQTYNHSLPEGHRFPMLKYELIPEQLIYEGSITESQLFEPAIVKEKNVLLSHSEVYLKSLIDLNLELSMIRKIGFPLSKELIERELQITQGTIECALFAIEYGASFNVAGGTHHAFSDSGEGFCLINDIAVSSNYLLNEGLRKRILIVDLDVHQGNGTASIFQNEERVFTFSMHAQNNYPLKKQNSNLDIGLPDRIEDQQYLQLLGLHLPKLFQFFEPDFVFFQSGVDILKTDRLGRLGVSKEGCRQRDEMVFNLCKQNKVPVVAVMGGGYSTKISDIVDAHCNTFKAALEIFF
jgi:acetoin utilization deacetylase AcuC-like enzyme